MILYEVHNVPSRTGNGIATYARNLTRAAGRLGHRVGGLFGAGRSLAAGAGPQSEVLAFDAMRGDEFLSSLALAWRYACYPFNALGGLRPVEFERRGLASGPMAEVLQPFDRVFAAPRLIDVSIAHFRIYGRFAGVNLPGSGPDSRPSLFHATHPVPLTMRGCPNIYTVHDLAPLRVPYATHEHKKYFYRLLTHLARTADHVVTVSEHSRRDIIDQLGVEESRVTNTYQAVDIAPHLLARSNDEVARDLEALFGLEFGNYFLFYGAIEPRKNVSRLVDAYAASGSRLPLIIAGGGCCQNKSDLCKKMRNDRDVVRRERQVRHLKYVPHDQLVALIRGARALLFPSVYEGFGLPVLESMALGTPVITSNVSSLPEVAGDAALLVNPHAIEDISRAIQTIEADGDYRTELSARGRLQCQFFSVDAYDRRIGELYDHLGV